MLTIQQLLAVTTAAQFRAQMVTSLTSLGIPAGQWKSGGIASTILTVVSNTLGNLSSGLTTTLQGFFLPTATGDGLKLLAFYVYGLTEGVDYPAATSANGNLTIINSGGGVYSFLPGQLVALNTTTNVTYTNSANVSIGAGQTVTGIPFQATVQGRAGNASPGQINAFSTTLLGLSVTNPGAFVGTDAISDAALQALCLNSLGIRSVRGPRTAYAYAIQTAKNSVTGAPVNINRWTITPSSHTGTVQIYISSPSGVVDPNDLAGVVANIEALARPDAVTVTTTAASPVSYTETITVYAAAPVGVTQAQVQTAVAAQLSTFFSIYPIGGLTASDETNLNFTGVFRSGVAGACGIGASTVGAFVTSIQGAADQALISNEVATDNVSLTVVLTTLPTAGA